MPIYEFKCLKCGEKVEILFRSSSDQVEMKCVCGSDNLERVISASNFAVTGGGGSKSSGVQSTSRACGGGSCTTYDIPGPK